MKNLLRFTPTRPAELSMQQGARTGENRRDDEMESKSSISVSSFKSVRTHGPNVQQKAHLKMYFLLNIIFVASGFQIQLRGLAAGWD